MKLASLKSESRDGVLVVVSRDLSRAIKVPDIAPHLQAALDQWERAKGKLEWMYAHLNEHPDEGFPFSVKDCASPLPRAYQWLDASAYLSHVRRVRKARGADMPDSFLNDPLMYQGGSDFFLAPQDPIAVENVDWGADCEAEVAVITGDVAQGVASSDAAKSIRLLMLVNDISLRNLIPNELAKGFGFLQGKPPTAFSPVAVSPAELGDAWDGGRIKLPIRTFLNDHLLGQPNAGVDMQFDFPELISHAAKTRPLRAGTIVGSGTVSNEDTSVGCCCLVERRVLEILDTGQAITPYLGYGDHIRIEMLDQAGQSIFGAIDQKVQPCPS